jgi:hypothetical protein
MIVTAALFGIGLEAAQLGDWPLRILAVVGAAAVGGFGAGLILQLSAKFLAAQKVPRPILQGVRVLGALTLGLLVGYFLLHSGGSGGGWGLGGGSGRGLGTDGNDKKAENHDKDSTYDKDRRKPAELAKGETTVQIEVLQDPTKGGRHYRVLGESKLWTFDELKEMLVERSKQETPMERMVSVVYEDSPDSNTPIVRNLRELATENKLTFDISERRGNAP